MFLFVCLNNSSNICVLVLYWKEIQMAGETSSESYGIERIEWTYGKGDKESKLNITYNKTTLVTGRGFIVCNRKYIRI